jgi:hypothetical protein
VAAAEFADEEAAFEDNVLASARLLVRRIGGDRAPAVVGRQKHHGVRGAGGVVLELLDQRTPAVRLLVEDYNLAIGDMFDEVCDLLQTGVIVTVPSLRLPLLTSGEVADVSHVGARVLLRQVERAVTVRTDRRLAWRAMRRFVSCAAVA